MSRAALTIMEIVLVVACVAITWVQAYAVGKRDGIRECRGILDEQVRDHNAFVRDVLSMMHVELGKAMETCERMMEPSGDPMVERLVNYQGEAEMTEDARRILDRMMSGGEE